jgi:biopolymer transport protein ExbD
MKIGDRLKRRVLARRKCQPLTVVGVALEMAMAGVITTLLIIMMLVIGSLPYSLTLPIEVKAGEHAVPLPAAIREDAIRILITRDGVFYLDSSDGYRNVQVADMADQVREKVLGGAEKRAYLMVDQRAYYGDVRPVFDAIRDGGIWNVSLIAGIHEPLR